MYRKNKVSEILIIDLIWEALARRASCSEGILMSSLIDELDERTSSIIMTIGAVLGGFTGLYIGFTGAGIGGAIVGIVIGSIIGAIGIILVLEIGLIILIVSFFLGIIAAVIYVISLLWGVGKP